MILTHTHTHTHTHIHLSLAFQNHINSFPSPSFPKFPEVSLSFRLISQVHRSPPSFPRYKIFFLLRYLQFSFLMLFSCPKFPQVSIFFPHQVYPDVTVSILQISPGNHSSQKAYCVVLAEWIYPLPVLESWYID